MPVLLRLAILLLFLLASARAIGATAHADPGNRDPYAACNRSAAELTPMAMRNLDRVVFGVWVTRQGVPERTGTATLIDDTGIFITAGHTVHFDRNRPIKLKRVKDAAEETVDVEVMTDTSGFLKKDFVLLRARGWINGARRPYPIRLDESASLEAYFIGYGDAGDNASNHVLKYYRDDAGQPQFQTQVFGNSSGSLVFDKSGRGFALIVKHASFQSETLSGMTPEKLFEEFNVRAKVSVFRLEDAIPQLKEKLPPSTPASTLMSRMAGEVDIDLIPSDLWRWAPIDLIHLIDSAYLGEVRRKWKSKPSALSTFYIQLWHAAGEACVLSYLATTMATMPTEAVGTSANSTKAGSSGPNPTPNSTTDPAKTGDPNAPNSDDSLSQTGSNTPEKAAAAGQLYLDRALDASRNRGPLEARFTKIALDLLRHSAASNNVRDALRIGKRDRDLAALLGNLALAEELGTRFNIGSRDAAQKAIFAASSLGGSPTAYELAANYALEERDTRSAAALLAQAYGRVNEGIPQGKATMAALDSAFRSIASQAGLPPNVAIADYRAPDIRFADSKWSPLAFGKPINFEFSGLRLALNESVGGAPPETIKVGVLHSLSGVMAANERTLKDTILFLIDEQNKKGGVMGKKLEAVVVDPASNWPLFAEKARELITKDKVAVVFGCWTSVSRKSVLPVFKELNNILFYPVQYEGEESQRNVFYTGAVPNQQAIPAVDYLINEGKVRRFVLAGTDYVYPRTTNKILESYLKSKGVKQEDIMINYTPFGHSDWQRIVADIRKFGSAGKKTAVVSTINGDANVPFYKELDNQGIKATDIPVVAFSVDEEELAGIDTKPLLGHLAAQNYFQSIKTQANERFIKDWQTYTKNPKRVTNDAMEAHYIGFNMWVKAVEKVKSIDPDKVIDGLPGVEVPNLTGSNAKMLPNHHITKPVFIGEIKADGQFDVVWKTPGPVAGDAWSKELEGSKDLIGDWVGKKCGNFNVTTNKCSN